jgi:general secretion pathway protein J
MIRKHRGGFTLVEVLLTLGILATLFVLLLSSFVGAERGLDVLSGRAKMFRQVRIAMDRVASDLSGAFASDNIESTALSCRTDLFSGKPASTLAFSAFALPETSGPRPASDLVKVRYFPKVSDDGASIDLYREQADLPLIGNRIPTVESRLAKGLKEFRIELFDGQKWLKEWPPAGGRKTSLPKAVSVILVDSQEREYRRSISLPLAGREGRTVLSGARKTENR